MNNLFITLSCNYTNGFVRIPSIISNTIIINPICFGGYGSVSIGISGGIPPYVYFLNGIDTNNLLAGNYTIFISDQTGETISVSFQLINPTLNSISQSLTICSNETYNIGDNIYNLSGNYIDTLISNFGCDSIIYTNLSVIPISQSITTIIKCDSYTWNGTTYTSSGTYTWLGTNVLDVIVQPS